MLPEGRCSTREADPNKPEEQCEPCTAHEHCEDFDPCTEDVCCPLEPNSPACAPPDPARAGGCRHQAVDGLRAATCQLEARYQTDVASCPVSGATMCELPPNCQGDERCPFVCAKNGTSPPRYPPAVCNIDKGRAEICNDIVNACRKANAKRMKRTLRKALGRIDQLERNVIVKAASFTPSGQRLGKVCARVLALRLQRAQTKLQELSNTLKRTGKRRNALQNPMETLCAGPAVTCEPALEPGGCD